MDSNTTLIVIMSVAVILIGVYMMCKCDGNKDFFVGSKPLPPCSSGQKRCCGICGCVPNSQSCDVDPNNWFGCQGCSLSLQWCQSDCNKNDKNCLTNCNNIATQCYSVNNCKY
jgi:hypothetical protein